MFDTLIGFIREQYRTAEFIPLHAPVFNGQERSYVTETIDSTFVSSVGAYVDRFEREMAAYTGSARAVATVNGTAALHVALLLAGVVPNDLVITQPLTFVATCNAIAYCGAEPVFIDVDRSVTMACAAREMTVGWYVPACPCTLLVTRRTWTDFWMYVPAGIWRL
jgi:dTDP-4-amino-4,6-dideoxygalactose transaminase